MGAVLGAGAVSPRTLNVPFPCRRHYGKTCAASALHLAPWGGLHHQGEGRHRPSCSTLPVARVWSDHPIPAYLPARDFPIPSYPLVRVRSYHSRTHQHLDRAIFYTDLPTTRALRSASNRERRRLQATRCRRRLLHSQSGRSSLAPCLAGRQSSAHQFSYQDRQWSPGVDPVDGGRASSFQARGMPRDSR